MCLRFQRPSLSFNAIELADLVRRPSGFAGFTLRLRFLGLDEFVASTRSTHIISSNAIAPLDLGIALVAISD